MRCKWDDKKRIVLSSGHATTGVDDLVTSPFPPEDKTVLRADWPCVLSSSMQR